LTLLVRVGVWVRERPSDSGLMSNTLGAGGPEAMLSHTGQLNTRVECLETHRRTHVAHQPHRSLLVLHNLRACANSPTVRSASQPVAARRKELDPSVGDVLS